jgi:hypothetical protein
MVHFGHENLEMARVPGSRSLSYARVEWAVVKKRWGIYIGEGRVEGDYAIVFHDKHPDKPWLMDHDKFEEVTAEEKNWRPHKNGNGHWHIYSPTNKNLAAVLVPPGEGLSTDHDNRDPFDNRVANLFPRTRQQQAQNKGSKGKTSRFQGVHKIPEPRRSQWRAYLFSGGTRVHDSYHPTELEAARAYVQAHRENPATAWMWEGGPYEGFEDPLGCLGDTHI